MKQKVTLNSMSNFILLIAGFLLFWEWLRPLEQITDTGNVYLFVIYAAICFLVSFFIHNGWAKFSIKLVSLLFILDYLFLRETLLSKEWFQVLSLEFRYNIEIIGNNDWYLMTSLFRSLLFLLLLWLMSYLLHYWFTIANKFFLFVLLTIVYLAVLDTFTVYDAQLAMVRAFIVSFIILGLSRYVQLMDNGAYKDNIRHVFTWTIPIIVIVVMAALLGIYSPKLNPQWPDPVPFIQSTAGHVGFGSGSVQKVGYGEDDSRLGGSFVQDDSKVFEAIAHDDIYWRIESKDVYTGKGWERSEELNYQALNNGQVNWRTFPLDRTETKPYETMVHPVSTNSLPKVVYPYGVSQLGSIEEQTFFMDYNTGMIEVESSEQSQGSPYSIQYNAPSFSLDELKRNSDNDPEDIKEKYLQLPEGLPDRVVDLANEVVEGKENRYDQAKAIESYFAANGYTYQIEDVSIPEDGGEDYVDQFLFETQIGYCDNFSTSMVVMLRSLDIPARWVKGFTGGTEASEQPALPDDYKLYEITNNNAHSWVEVYFPESGWVPFEPTSGFSNPTEFYQEVTSDTETEIDRTEEEQTEQETVEETKEKEKTEEEEKDTSATGASDNQNGGNGWLYVLIGLIVLLIISAIIVYVRRYQIRDWYALKKWQRLSQKLDLESGYFYLLNLLEKKGFTTSERTDTKTICVGS
ncbi:transglutaminase domain-containing protein [Gracilibacillus boraciitolerans]|uniref:transglutaminase domain-containing protein n=1 Tax=Gracilibacillus boraciitolerans TaxID=307521 RepID=UPI001F2D05E6|nr:transglutaminase domain-containing protein [Gracilibacillus boraciitolerans]